MRIKLSRIKTKIKKIDKALINHFGVPPRSKKLPDPVELLIATILSQNTNDKNSYRAYKNLKEKYESWEKVAELPLSKIQKEIKVAGLAKQKSSAIKNFLTTLKQKNNNLNLHYLKKMSDEKILNELITFKGIGIKTASCVLLFSLDRNVCPVDTHVHRTLNRIGLVNANLPEKTFILINQHIPEGIAHQLHTNLIRLGREICKSAKPNCIVCPLIKICKYENKNFSVANNYKQNSFMLLDEIK
jgi:endonuclease III